MSGNDSRLNGRAKKRFRPLIDDRLSAVDMLAVASSAESVIDLLALKHPKYTREEVRDGYFPARGVFFIGDLLGASAAAINAAKQKIQIAHTKYSARGRAMFDGLWQDSNFARQTADFGRANLKRLNENPVFQQQRAQRNREYLAILHQDPIFAAKRDKIATARLLLINSSAEARERARRKFERLNQDSAFQAKAHEARWTSEQREAERVRMLLRRSDSEYEQARIDGLQDYWREYRRLKAIGERAYLEDAGISIIRRGRQGFLNLGDLRYLPDAPIVQRQRHEMLFNALSTLDEYEMHVIKLMFFSADHHGGISHTVVAEITGMPTEEIEGIYEAALGKLRNHEGLAAVI